MDAMAVKEVPCGCGCGLMVKSSLRNGRLILFKSGHSNKKRMQDSVGTEATCLQCGKDFVRKGWPFDKPQYCSMQCYQKAWYNRKKCPGKYAQSNPRRRDLTVFKVSSVPRVQRLYLLAQVKSCEACGWDSYVELLEMDHLNGNHRDGRRENLKLLCPNCHAVRHFLDGTGRHDNSRYKRARLIREKFGLTTVSKGLTRTTLQRLYDEGKVTVQ